MRAITAALICIAMLAGCSAAEPVPEPVSVVTEVVTERVVVPVPQPQRQPIGTSDYWQEQHAQEEMARQLERIERHQQAQQWQMQQQQAEMERQLEEQADEIQGCIERELEGDITLGC
jgi:TolA-binding protein